MRQLISCKIAKEILQKGTATQVKGIINLLGDISSKDALEISLYEFYSELDLLSNCENDNLVSQLDKRGIRSDYE